MNLCDQKDGLAKCPAGQERGGILHWSSGWRRRATGQ